MLLKISDLQLNTGQIEGVPSNPRTITEKDFEELKESLTRNPDNIKKFPLVIAEHKKQLVVISGNQRLRAMQALGWTELEHVGEIYPDGTDPEILKEAVIIANTHKGEWDYDALANDGWEQDDLETWGVDTTQEWAAEKDLPDDIDEIPAAPKTPVTKLGDLWLLDGHRVLCGDSTDKQTVERLMDGRQADMVFTDPPYGMNLDTDYSKMPSTKAEGNKTHKAVIGDDEPFNYEPFAWIDCKEQIWFGANYYAKTLPDEGSWLVWDKRVEEKFDKMFGSGFEIAWSKTPHKQKIYRHNNTLFGGDSEARGKEHPTQKPTKLLVEMMDDMVKDSKSVLDLFLGSGSTLIACEQTDRTCYGLELDPLYVDVICKRWQTLTGQLPILEATGEAHDFIGVQ